MLQFFRKYQKFFFLFITIIIVITFAFFGTYQAFAPSGNTREEKEEVLFLCCDGKKITNIYFSALTGFLQKEAWMQPRANLLSCYFNDGIISADFLEGKTALLLCKALGPEFVEELNSKYAKEREFVPYSHPQIRFVSAENVWALFAPEICEKLGQYKIAEKPDERMRLRLALFNAQRKFPPALLGQVLRYQERDHALYPDHRLMREDLALFGYKDLAEWFGPHFIESVAKIIVHVAAIAREQGYRISHDEVMSELVMKSQKCVDFLRGEHEDFPLTTGYELLQSYLRENNVREKDLVRLWEDISLFRRYMTEVSQAAFVDTLTLQTFNAYAHESATVEVFQLPQELRFQNVDELKKFEAYLTAVGETSPSLCAIPSHYLPLEKVEAKVPELVGRHYRLFFSEVNKESLRSKVTLKEMWDWECINENWVAIKARFPELAQKEDDPFTLLEALDAKQRKLIDHFACDQIVAAHPEWVEEVLKDKMMDEKEFFITQKSGAPFAGIQDVPAFEKILEQQKEVIGYTQDNEIYYRFLVQDRGEHKEIMPFKNVMHDNFLDELAKQIDVTPLLDALAQKYSAEKREPKQDDVYAAYRCACLLDEGNSEEALTAQWKVEKKLKTVTRAEPSLIRLTDAVALEEKALSEVQLDSKEGIFCYRVIEHKTDTTFPLEKMLQAQKALTQEVKSRFFETLIQSIPL